MAYESDASEPRIRGEDAWKAERNATELRNDAAKKRAHDKQSASSRAVAERERRLDRLEAAQLAALNQKISARAAEHP
jgi:hypothetical protein